MDDYNDTLMVTHRKIKRRYLFKNNLTLLIITGILIGILINNF